jgi:hypothetical protein
MDHKGTWCRAYVMSVLPPKAAIRQRDWRVRYVPRPDMLRVGTKLLVPQAGLEPMAVRVSTMTPLFLLNQSVYWNILWGVYISSAAPAASEWQGTRRPHFGGDRMTPPGKNRRPC